MPSKKKNPTGTREWAVKNVNFCRGCEHMCLYCYARANALRFKQIISPDEWKDMKIDYSKVDKRWQKINGTIMLPSTHDITPKVLKEAVIVIRNILAPGNKLLIVSKPHFDCIKKICDEFNDCKDQIMFRFTIGSFHNDVLKFWEPNAPDFDERLASLKYAFENGFTTSVSCEPFLDEQIRDLFYQLEPYVNDYIWVGLMNQIKQRVDTTGWTRADLKYLWRVEACQTKSEVQRLYDDLKHHKKVKWKDSIKTMLGLEKPSKIGMDV